MTRPPLRRALGGLALLLTTAAIGACGSDDSPTVAPESTAITGPRTDAATRPPSTSPPSSTATATFPLSIDDQHRLVDANERPFLMVGDTAWSLIAGLTREEATQYLDDRAARGFNTLLVNLIEHRFVADAPANAYGELPFAPGSPFTSPNERYFEHADWILGQAAERGMLVVLLPAYAGYEGNSDGWYAEMQEVGAEVLAEYGRWVGERYDDLTNIVWAAGGDFTPARRDLVDAIQEGIRAADPDAIQTAHGDPEAAAADEFPNAGWLDLNNVYSQLDVYPLALDQQRRGELPFFLIESTYEDEHDATTAQLREQAYAAMLAGATGQIFGNNPIWHFDGPGIFDAPSGWQDALDSPGARSMTVLGDFFRSIAWWQLAPAPPGFVADTTHERRPTMAAASADGTLVVVYVPDERTIEIDPAVLGDAAYRATWIDPADGTHHGGQEVVDVTSPNPIVVDAVNDDGASDWLLVLEPTT